LLAFEEAKRLWLWRRGNGWHLHRRRGLLHSGGWPFWLRFCFDRPSSEHGGVHGKSQEIEGEQSDDDPTETILVHGFSIFAEV
jgi:hypothetical protein